MRIWIVPFLVSWYALAAHADGDGGSFALVNARIYTENVREPIASALVAIFFPFVLAISGSQPNQIIRWLEVAPRPSNRPC